MNAWIQYREARELAHQINKIRRMLPTPAEPRQNWSRRISHWLRCQLGSLCLALPNILDQLRMLLYHGSEKQAFDREQRESQNDEVLRKLNGNQLPWTTKTAFYALSGGIVLTSEYGMGETLSDRGLIELAKADCEGLLPIQRAVMQDPSKASGIAKLITCTQVLWFCSQCVARLSARMAISLLELNPFAHCISTLFIYLFWWDKPYGVNSHLYLASLKLYQVHLMQKGAENMFLDITELEADIRDARIMIADCRTSSSSTLAELRLGADLMIKPHNSTLQPRQTKIKMEENTCIPGTGFALRGACTYDHMNYRRHNGNLFASDHSIAYWKRLWNIREHVTSHRRPGLEDFDIYDMFTRCQRKWIVGSSYGNICHARCKNLDVPLLNRTLLQSRGYSVPTIMIVTFMAYGALHLLAWQYQFQTRAEQIAWRCSSITVTSSGSVIFLGIIDNALRHWWCKLSTMRVLRDIAEPWRKRMRTKKLLHIRSRHWDNPVSHLIIFLSLVQSWRERSCSSRVSKRSPTHQIRSMRYQSGQHILRTSEKRAG